MSSSAQLQRVARGMELVLGHRATPWIVAAAFVIHGVWSIAGDHHLHDEGLLTYIFAAWLREAPLAALFFQKAKPITSLLYAPTTLFGYGGFFLAHVLVSALAIPMLGAIAKRVNLSLPALPALLFAASPMYLGSAPAGLSNADGVVAVVLFLYVLICLERPMLAGFVLGCIPWVRYELMLLVVVFAVYAAIWQRRMLLGVFVFPAVYLLSGAAYHGSLLWPLAFPPAMPAPMPGNPIYVGELAGFGVGKVGLTLLAVCPAAILAPMVRLRWLGRHERTLLVFGLSYFVAMNVLPLWQIFNFGFTPRYSLGLLPVLALFAGRVLGEWWKGSEISPSTLPTLALAFVAGLAARPGTQTLLWLAVAATALVALKTSTRSRAATALALAGTLGVIPILENAVDIRLRSRHAYMPEVVRWLHDARGRLGRGPVVTDIAILDALLKRSGGLPELEVHFLVGADQEYEVAQLTNPRNGQRERLFAAMDAAFYGRPLLSAQLTPAKFPQGTVFVLSKDERLRLIMPEAIWRDRLRVVQEGDRYTIAELVEPR